MFAHATVLKCERGARPGKSRHGTEVSLSRDTRANNKISSEKCEALLSFVISIYTIEIDFDRIITE